MTPRKQSTCQRRMSGCAAAVVEKHVRVAHRIGRPLARPAVGARACRRRAPDPLALSCLRLFWLLSFGLYVSAPAGLAPPSSGPAAREMPCGAPSSLISFGNFPPLALRVDRPPSATAPQASPAAKTTTGERGAGRSP